MLRVMLAPLRWFERLHRAWRRSRGRGLHRPTWREACESCGVDADLVDIVQVGAIVVLGILLLVTVPIGCTAALERRVIDAEQGMILYVEDRSTRDADVAALLRDHEARLRAIETRPEGH